MRHLSFIALLFATGLAFGDAAQDEAAARVNRATALASEKRLAERPEWRALLHMHRDVLFRLRSSIDDPDFFLHPRGHVDPFAEMTATVEAFAGGAQIDGEPTACHYPARYEWLRSELDLPAAPTCERFDTWRDKMDAVGVSLIFSSYYLNNPASMYGHTLLKLTRNRYAGTGSLLDYTVNYAAIADTRNGLMYILKGLFGGFPGRFSTEPYYVKIQQYNNMEARDLWEYKLKFDQPEVDRIVAHLWEIGRTDMSYFFFNKNCSYQLLPLLEVGRPELSLSSEFRYRTIPLDTLLAVLDEKDFVEERILRPSHMRTMLARRALLNPGEERVATALANSQRDESLQGVALERQGLVLDAAYDLFRYRSGFQRVQPDHVREAESRLLALRRTTASLPPAPLDYGATPPELGHKTGRIGVYVGSDESARFQELSVRPSLHDLEEEARGFLPGSQLEMFHVRLRHREGPGLHLEELNVFEVISLMPWDRWIKRPSWTVRANVEAAHDLGRAADKSLVAGLDGGAGFSWSGGPANAVTLYAMAKADLEIGDAARKGHRIGPAAQAGALLSFGRRFRLHTQGTATRFVSGGVGNRIETDITAAADVARDLALRVSGRRSDGHKEAMAGFNFYW